MRYLKFLAYATLLLATGSLYAGDIEAGKTKATICVACHGVNGISNNPLWPNLAGQKERYLAKQIRAFKSGARQGPMMAPIVSPLSDQDIDNLAAYYASLK